MLQLMRWYFGPSHMVRRTCQDCGETWTLHASDARMHPGRPRGLTAFGAGMGGTVGAGAAQSVSRERVAEAGAGFNRELETIRQLRTCPKCGGDHHEDRRVRTEIG
jgi:ribosomal protein S27AE